MAWLALLVVVGAGAYWWFTRAPEQGSLQLAVEPKNAQLVIDGNIVATGSPFVVGDLEPTVAHAIEVTKEGYHPWTIKLQLQPGQRMALPDVALEPVESGFALDSVPSGATVVIDGKPLDDTTPIRLTELQPGDHQVRLESPGYAAWESSLHVVVGKVLDLPKAELTPLVGEGAAPAPERAEEPAEPPTAAPRQATRRPSPPRAPRARRPEPRPEPKPEPVAAAPVASSGGGEGTLRVQTTPWSKVFVDGRLIGNTPQMGIRLSAGSHSVTFVNDDFGIRKTVKIKIGAGETVTKVLTLTE